MNKILIVEDDNALRTNIIDLLQAEGYTVASAGDALEALAYLKKEIPDLIISDIMMPFMDGIEFMKRVQTDQSLCLIPFIFLTAKVDLKDLRNGMSVGADDYLLKPFKTKELLEAISTRLKKKELVDGRLDEIKNFIAEKVPHELKTPLIPILGYSDIIIEEINQLNKDDILQIAKAIKNAGERLYERVEKFLVYTEIELLCKEGDKIGGEQNNHCHIEQTELEFNLENIIKSKGRESDVVFSIEGADMKISDRHLIIVLFELIDNAMKFSKEGNQIKITGVTAENNYKIIVEDEGCGMLENNATHIEAFKQFRRELYQQSGVGLGLAIVKKIMDLFGGKLEIKNKEERGTLVTVLIPLQNN